MQSAGSLPALDRTSDIHYCDSAGVAADTPSPCCTFSAAQHGPTPYPCPVTHTPLLLRRSAVTPTPSCVLRPHSTRGQLTQPAFLIAKYITHTADQHQQLATTFCHRLPAFSRRFILLCLLVLVYYRHHGCMPHSISHPPASVGPTPRTPAMHAEWAAGAAPGRTCPRPCVPASPGHGHVAEMTRVSVPYGSAADSVRTRVQCASQVPMYPRTLVCASQSWARTRGEVDTCQCSTRQCTVLGTNART